jgi:hypothetical protein
MTWRVIETHSVGTSPDRDTVAAYLVTIERDGEQRRVMVELAGTAAIAGRTLDAPVAWDAVRDYLEDDDPPTHLIVTSAGIQPAE